MNLHMGHFNPVNAYESNTHRIGRNGLEVKLQVAGWILFIICAVLFIAASLKNRDPLTLLGSLIFLIACILFLLPLVKSKTNKKS